MLALIMGFAACQPNIHPQPKGDDDYIVGPAKDTRTVTFEAKDRWSVINSNDWFYVTPGAGLAGEVKVTVKFDRNSGMKDRQGSFYVIDGANTYMYTFTQECENKLSLDTDEYHVPESGSFVVVVRSNVDYSVSADADWILMPSQTDYHGDGTDMEIEFGLKDNMGKEARTARLIFTTDQGETLTADVVQNAHVDVEWNRPFYKGILGYRFTGDWCGYCPYLAYDINRFTSDYPGRLNVLVFYDSISDASLRFGGSSKYETRFAVAGKPTWVLDERGQVYDVASPVFYNTTLALAKEDMEAFPANCAISADVTMKGGVVNIHPTVYVKEAGEYHIHVALLESGLVVPQTDYTGLYTPAQLEKFQHNNVVRKYATEMLVGDAFRADAHSSVMFNYTCEIPSNVKNRNKLSVAIYVTRPTVKGPEQVARFTYYRDHTEFADNSVIVPVGQSVQIKYE